MRSLLGDYLLQRLQQDIDGTLQLRLFRCLRNAIIDSVLAPRTRLPASRDLAKEIKVSRNTVLSAYEQLQAQGYVEARTGQGTWVAEKLPESFLVKAENTNSQAQEKKTQQNYNLSQRGSYLIGYSAASPYQWGAFVPGAPDVTEFPHHIFSRIQTRLSREPEINSLIYSNAGGCLELRQELAEYLKIARSVQCDADQIIITEGTHQAIDLVSRTLSDPGDEVWIEDPAYWGARNILRINGVNLRSLPVDQEGIIPDLDPKTPPKLIFVTPSHQYPLGSHLSLERRKQLIAIARQHKSWIVEDDYDSEFRYHGKPLPPLKSLDAPQRVIYAGTFSKSMFPALRTAWLVVPLTQVEHFRQQAALTACSVPVLWQQTLADFMQDGHFWRHLKRMRQNYALRRQWMENALSEQGFNVIPQEGGIQLVITVDGDDVALVRKANQAGLAVQALSRWRITSAGKGGILLSFTNISSVEMAQQAAYQLRMSLT